MVITDVNQVVYLGDGVTTAFPFTFRIIDATDVKLLLIDADGTETDITSDYFVDTVNNTVHYPGYAPGAEPAEADQPAPVQTGQRLVVYRELPVTQEKDLGDKWPFFVIELALDKLTMLIQQVKGIWDRCLKVPVGQEATAPDFNYTVPIEAGKTFRVNDAGTGFEVTEDPKAAREAAEAAQAAAEEAQGKAEDAQEAAEQAQEDAEDAKDVAEDIASQIDIMARALVYDNVASMVADTTLEAGQTTATKGYYSVNDGGSSIYSIRAKTQDDVDDGGSIIFLDNGNVAELITDGVANVKQFGATGDGVTDDTTAFQKTFAYGAKNNQEIIISEGDYIVSRVYTETADPINITGKGRVVIKSNVTTDWSDPNLDYVLGFAGKPKGDTETYNNSLTKGQTAIPKAGLNVAVGDLLTINSNQLVFGENRSSWTNGGVFKVIKVDSSYIYLASELHIDFPAPSTTDLTVTESIDKKHCKFGNVNATREEMLYDLTAKTGVNVGTAVPHRYITDWDNVTKIATFETSNLAVKSTNGDKTWVNAPAVGDVYTLTKTLTVNVCTPVTVKIKGDIHITRDPVYDGSCSSPAAITIFNGADCVIDGLTVSNYLYAGIRIFKCWNSVISNCLIRDINGASLGYGIQTSGCNQFRIINCYVYGCRSGFSTSNAGLNDIDGMLENVVVRASGDYVDSVGAHFSNPQGFGLGSHGNAYRMLYKNCVFFDILQSNCYGAYCTYNNCVAYGAESCFMMAHQCMGLQLLNCKHFPRYIAAQNPAFLKINGYYTDEVPLVVKNCYSENIISFVNGLSLAGALNKLHLVDNTIELVSGTNFFSSCQRGDDCIVRNNIGNAESVHLTGSTGTKPSHTFAMRGNGCMVIAKRGATYGVYLIDFWTPGSIQIMGNGSNPLTVTHPENSHEVTITNTISGVAMVALILNADMTW